MASWCQCRYVSSACVRKVTEKSCVRKSNENPCVQDGGREPCVAICRPKVIFFFSFSGKLAILLRTIMGYNNVYTAILLCSIMLVTVITL